MKIFRDQGIYILLSDLVNDLNILPPLPIDTAVAWPEGVVDLFDNIGVIGYETEDDEKKFGIEATLLFATELAFELPGLEGFALVIGSTGDKGSIITLEFTSDEKGMKFCVEGNIAFRFSREMLKPVRKVENNGGWQVIADKFAEIRTSMKVCFDGEGNITFPKPPMLGLDYAMIGNSGIVISAQDVIPILGNTLPASILNDPKKPKEINHGWRGVYIKKAEIHFPKDLDILPVTGAAIENCYIGSGGFTGECKPALKDGSLFGFEFKADAGGTCIAFRQNALTKAEIKGKLKVPFFDGEVDVDVGLDMDGNLTAMLVKKDGFCKLETPGVPLVYLKLDRLGFELKDGVSMVKLGGWFSVAANATGLADFPQLYCKELVIDSLGNVDLDGGWLNLPQGKTFNFHGFKMEITKLGFGKAEDGRNYAGFSGSIMLVEGLPAGASVEGLRVLWGGGMDPEVTFNGVGVAFLVPDVLFFNGKIAFVDKGDDKRFEGAIRLDLYALELTMDAKLVFGTKNGYSYFAIYLAVELPAGIPLWATGLALYGMAGLFAFNMEPDKYVNEPWYGMGKGKGWYKRDPIGISDITNKWVPRQGSLALGAGVTIGTLTDGGYTFSGKMLLVIVFPGPILMIEGKANLLKERTSLDKEANFRALAVLDARAGTFLVGLDAQYKYGEKGELIDIRGSAEAYFSLSEPWAWHLYIGKKEPRDERIQASILKLFEANAYFMLDAHRLATGAWIGFSKKFDYGIVALELEAWIDGNAAISWKPAHFYGDLWLHGKIALRVLFIQLGLTADAYIETDVFDPFKLLARLSVEVDLPWPLPDFKVKLELVWGPELDQPQLPLPLQEVAVEHLKATTSWPLPRKEFLLPNYDSKGDGFYEKSTGSEEPTDLKTLPVVPMDGRPHITFRRPVNDDTLGKAKMDDRWERIGDPVKNQGPMKVRYGLKGIALYKQVGISWEIVARVGTSGVPADDSKKTVELFGSWALLPDSPDKNRAGVAKTKLWLWSRSEFDFTRNTSGAWQEGFSNHHCKLPFDRRVCEDFEEFLPDNEITLPHTFKGDPEIRLLPGASGAPETGMVKRLKVPAHGRTQALCFGQQPFKKSMQVKFSSPAKKVVVMLADRKRGFDFRRRNYETEDNPMYDGGVLFDYYKGNQRENDVEIMGETPSMESGLDCGDQEHRLEVRLPEPACYVKLTLTIKSTPAFIRAYDTHGSMLDMIRVDTPQGSPQNFIINGKDIAMLYLNGREAGTMYLHDMLYAPITQIIGLAITTSGRRSNSVLPKDDMIEIEMDDIDHVEISGNGEICLAGICAIFSPTTAAQQRQKERVNHLQAELARWQEQGIVLEPETTYRLKVLTTLEAKGEGVLKGKDQPEKTVEEYAYFQTGGPPGTNVEPYSTPMGAAVQQGEFKSGLDDLTLYVHQTVPPTVSAEGEKPLLPRPVYRAYDVGVEFNEDYVDLMYRINHRDLGLYLYDSNNRPVRGSHGALVVLANRWGDIEDLRLSGSEARSISTYMASTCLNPDTETITRNKKLASTSMGQVLKPNDLYEARLIPLLLHEDFRGYALNEKGDKARPSGLYRIIAVDIQKKTLTLDGKPAVTGNTAWEIPHLSAIFQTAGIGGAAGAGAVIEPGTMLLRDKSNWDNFRLSVQMRSSSVGGGAIGLVFRCDGSKYYCVILDFKEGIRRLACVSGSAQKQLEGSKFVFDADRDYLMTVEALGDSLRVYQDGAPVFDAKDSTLKSGKIGLFCTGNSGAHFSDIRVDDFQENAPVAYRFKFTTSRFANFFHHINSFQGKVWSLDLESDLTLGTLTGL
jgi:hypothetical protein